MTQSAGTSCAGRLQEASFCSFNDNGDGQTALHKEKRHATRFVHEEPVILETRGGDLIGAVVMNYSKNGLYFESNLKVHQGVILRIRNEATLASLNGGGCCAEVRWSKNLGEESAEYRYGTGVCYC
jgi:hypothetical protein